MIKFGEGRFAGRDIIEKPACPFCGRLIERPDGSGTSAKEMPVGSCSCGAVYACDVTGHNLGSALIEALVSACHGDWDTAWNLLPEDDYLQKEVDHYDYETHLIIHGGVYQGRRIAGTLFFIRLHRDTQEGVKEHVQKELPRTAPSAKKASKSTRILTKKDVEFLIESYDLDPLLSVAEEDTRIIRDLKRILYSGDRLLRWRAAEALGKVTSLIAQRDHRTIDRLLQGFFTSLTDTASSGWGALDAIGEIMSGKPEQFSDYLPQIFQLSMERSLLGEILRALGKIAAARPDLLRGTSHRVIALLQDPNPEVRGYAAILLGHLSAREAREPLEKLLEDPSEMEIYIDGFMAKRTVGQLASESLEKM